MTSMAQNTEGEVLYNVRINGWSHLPEDMPEDRLEMIKEFMPEWIENPKVLYFTSEESLFMNAEVEEDDEVDPNSGGMHFRVMMMGGEAADERYYTDITNQIKIEQKDLMGKLFLIEDSVEAVEWKLPGDMKMVQGYTCMKATTMRDDTMEMEVWFTMDIPVPTGPAGIQGLPGMVLEVTTDNGNFIIQADSVSLREVTKDELIKPTKGKEVTQEEYDEIAMEKYEEMRQQNGGHGGGRVMITHD